MTRHPVATLIGAGALVLFTLSGAQAQPPDQKPQCFWPNEWNGWKAAPDSKSIYLQVGANRIYRLDLAASCPELQAPDAHLVLHLHGSDTYCSALDFDLKVAEPPGIAVGCIVSKMTQLTPAEAAALPKNLKP